MGFSSIYNQVGILVDFFSIDQHGDYLLFNFNQKSGVIPKFSASMGPPEALSHIKPESRQRRNIGLIIYPLKMCEYVDYVAQFY